MRPELTQRSEPADTQGVDTREAQEAAEREARETVEPSRQVPGELRRQLRHLAITTGQGGPDDLLFSVFGSSSDSPPPPRHTRGRPVSGNIDQPPSRN
jgi:hypothetical protein